MNTYIELTRKFYLEGIEVNGIHYDIDQLVVTDSAIEVRIVDTDKWAHLTKDLHWVIGSDYKNAYRVN